MRTRTTAARHRNRRGARRCRLAPRRRPPRPGTAPLRPSSRADARRRRRPGARGHRYDSGTDTRELERAVRADPNDARSLVLLGYAYQQRWRETADASNLPRSEAALRRAARLDPTDALAVTGLGSLALIRHDFRAALADRAARAARSRRRAPAPTASSATRCSSSAATRRRSEPSSAWSRSGRASPRTRASPTHAS